MKGLRLFWPSGGLALVPHSRDQITSDMVNDTCSIGRVRFNKNDRVVAFPGHVWIIHHRAVSNFEDLERHARKQFDRIQMLFKGNSYKVAMSFRLQN